jgi:tetratricopeptide (TPR) repeat protein
MKPYRLALYLFAFALLTSCRSQYTRSERLMNRGVKYLENHKYEKGLVYLNRAIAADSTNLNAYLNRGCAYEDLGMYQESLKDYSFLFKKGYRHPYVYYNSGLAHHELKNYEKSIEMYDSALSLEPNVNFYIAKGTSLSDMGKLSAALQSYNQAYALAPDDQVLLYNFGYTYFQMKEYEKSEEYLMQAVRKGSKDEYVYLYLAKIFDLRGDQDRACQFFRHAVRLQPGGEQFKEEDRISCKK